MGIDLKPEPRKREKSNNAPSKRIVTGQLDINRLLAFAFGVVFISVMLILSSLVPNPSPSQLKTFNAVLALAAAGVGAVLPGFLEFRHEGYKTFARAGGAMALFAVVWFTFPKVEGHIVKLERPLQEALPSTVKPFLDHLDSGDIPQSYRDLDTVAREKMVPTEAVWRQLYDANVKPLGKLQRRKLMGRAAQESPVGHPIGLYEGYGYLAKYENIDGCRQEHVTVRATQDRQWRVYDYSINPNTIPCPPKFMDD
jgi:hypothetical protein